MNKKSAIATAGGLVASFAAGVAAVSFNWGLGVPADATAVAAASPPPKAKHVKPIIRHRTITVRKKAPQPKPSQAVTLASRPPVYQPAPPPSRPVASSGGSSAGGGGGGEGGDGEGGEGGGGDD